MKTGLPIAEGSCVLKDVIEKRMKVTSQGGRSPLCAWCRTSYLVFGKIRPVNILSCTQHMARK